MKLQDIVSAEPGLIKLAACDVGLRDAYRLKKLRDALIPELQFYCHRRRELFAQYGDGMTIPPERRAEALPDFEALLALEVEPDLPELPVRLPLSTGVKLSVLELDALAPFVVFEEKEAQ